MEQQTDSNSYLCYGVDMAYTDSALADPLDVWDRPYPTACALTGHPSRCSRPDGTVSQTAMSS